MQAILVEQVGGPEAMRAATVELSAPEAGQALVQQRAIGVNYIDIYHRTGLYPLPPPFTPGMEAAGVVSAVGADVSEVSVGDRVAYSGVPGAYAEAALVPAAQLVPVPAELDLELAAASLLQGMTAHYLAVDTFPLQQGSTALVHAAAGGVGRLLVQIAKRRGATVLATVSTAAKAELVSALGADQVIRYTEQDVAEAVARATAGTGVDVVYDSVGQATLDGSLQSLRRRGMLVSYGQSSGPITDFQPAVLSQRGSLYLTRPTLGDYVADRAALLARAGEVLRWVGSGELDVLVHARYPLAEAARAHEALASRGTVGKLLLIP